MYITLTASSSSTSDVSLNWERGVYYQDLMQNLRSISLQTITLQKTQENNNKDKIYTYLSLHVMQ